MRREDRDNDGDYNPTDPGSTDIIRYYLTDVQFSPVAITDEQATVIERISYDAYGLARHHHPADINGDGAVLSDDAALLPGRYGSFGAGDLDRSESYDASDAAVIAVLKAGLSHGKLSLASEDNQIGYCGYIFNAETEEYTVRHRNYVPLLGRWIELDPIGYLDGMALYEYGLGNPIRFMDSLGLQVTDEDLSFRALNPTLPKRLKRKDGKVCGPWVWFVTGYYCVEEEVYEAAFDEYGMTATDRLNGYGDAVGIDSLAQLLGGTDVTFDEIQRQRGCCFATCFGQYIINALIGEALGEIQKNLPVGLEIELTDDGVCPGVDKNYMNMLERALDKYQGHLEKRIRERPWNETIKGPRKIPRRREIEKAYKDALGKTKDLKKLIGKGGKLMNLAR